MNKIAEFACLWAWGMFAYGAADARGVAVRSFYQAWYQRAAPLERGEGALPRESRFIKELFQSKS